MRDSRGTGFLSGLRAHRTRWELAWGIGLLVLYLLLPTAPAAAFDPHEFGWDSDPAVPKTQFCLTNGGDYPWNSAAIARAGDAIPQIEGDVPGFSLIVDRTLTGCQIDLDPRVEIAWDACPIVANEYIGITWWHPDFPSGWDGTNSIHMMKYRDCGNLTDSGLVPWDFDPSDGILDSQDDFQEVLQHEMGHGLGLHHPEAARVISNRPGASTVPAHSYNGDTAVILMRDATTQGQRHVQLAQDDLSGFSWLDTRRYLARPNKADFWGTYQGNVLEGPGYLILTKDAGVPPNGYSYMFMTTRMTTDRRFELRETPDFSVQWRKTNGQSQNNDDRLRLRIAYRPVYSDGSVGSFAYIWDPSPCYDNHADDTWEWCTASFAIGDLYVQDIRVFIYNSTIGRVQINAIQLQDGA